MPRLPFDWLGMLKLALDIQKTGKQHRISLDGPGVEEKDIQITPDNDVPMVREVKAPGAREERNGFSRVELPYGSFQCALNLPDDANQDSKCEASAPKHGRSIPIEAESDISIAVATKSHQETRCRGLRPSSSQ